MKVYVVNNVIEFTYDGKVRRMRIESIKTGYRYGGLIGPVAYSVTGWDFTANPPTGGYRTFKVDKIVDPVIIAIG